MAECDVTDECDVAGALTTAGLAVVARRGRATGVRGFRLKILYDSGFSPSAKEAGEEEEEAGRALTEGVPVAVKAAMEKGSDDTGTGLLGLRDAAWVGAEAAPPARALPDVPVAEDRWALLRAGEVRSSTGDTCGTLSTGRETEAAVVAAEDGEQPWGLTLRRVRPKRSSLSVMGNILRGLGDSLGAAWLLGAAVLTDRSREGLEGGETETVSATGTARGSSEDPSTLLCRLSRRSFTVMPVFWKCAWPGSPAFLGDPAGCGEAVGMGRMGLGSGSAPGRASSKPTVDSGLPDLCRPLLARREEAVLGGSSPGCCAGARSKGLTWLNCTGTRPMGPTLPVVPRAEPSTATGTACTAAGLAAGRAMAEVGAPEGSGDVDTGTVGLDAGDLVGVAVE